MKTSVQQTVLLAVLGLGLSITLMSTRPTPTQHASLQNPNLAAQGTKKFAGFLRGTFIVRCPAGHDDQVDGITRNHDCEKCGRKAVDEGSANVVCPDGHATPVEGVTESHSCTSQVQSGALCGKQCRR